MAETDDAIRWIGRLDPAAGPRYLQIVTQFPVHAACCAHQRQMTGGLARLEGDPVGRVGDGSVIHASGVT